MTVMIPQPEGIILHPRLIADRAYWWSFVRTAWKIRGFFHLRDAITSVNHGTRHDGRRYRQCYRLHFLEVPIERHSNDLAGRWREFTAGQRLANAAREAGHLARTTARRAGHRARWLYESVRRGAAV